MTAATREGTQTPSKKPVPVSLLSFSDKGRRGVLMTKSGRWNAEEQRRCSSARLLEGVT